LISCPASKPSIKKNFIALEPGKPEEYPYLQNVLTRPIRWGLIEEQYDLRSLDSQRPFV
jgi:hypothetical protein